MVEHWTFSLFFCVAELWGSVVISVLFWTLANDVCTVADAKTIYPLMGIAANIALVVAGNYMKWVNRSLVGGSVAASLQVRHRCPCIQNLRSSFLCQMAKATPSPKSAWKLLRTCTLVTSFFLKQPRWQFMRGRPCLCVSQVLVGTVFVLSGVMMAAKLYIDRSVQPEDVRLLAT